MKVILLTDVERLGKRGEVVNVRDGYARNYLIPNKLALASSGKNPAQLESIRAQVAGIQQKVVQRLAQQAERLGAVTLKTTLKMGAEGAFGAVTNGDVARLLAEQGHDVDKHSIVLEEPIKAPGVYDIPVKLGHEVTAVLKLWVIEEPA